MSEEKAIGEAYIIVEHWRDGARSVVTSAGVPQFCPDPVSAFMAMHKYGSGALVGNAEIVKVRITNHGRWEEIGDESEEAEAQPASSIGRAIIRRRRRKGKGRAT